MRTRLFALAILTQFFCGNALAQWQKIQPDTFSNFTSVFFTTPTKGYLIGCDPVQSSWSSNGLYMTEDGGATWTGLRAAELCPGAVFFPDSNTGYFLPSGSATGAQGVDKTTDGGHTWARVHTGVVGENLYFVDANTGYATAANTMMKTTDGGVTWTPQYLGGPSILDGVHYVSKDTGFVGGWYTGLLAKTTDGGNSWSMLSFDYGVHAMYFPSAQVGYIAGEDLTNNNPVISKTVDGGATWTVKYRIPSAMPLFFTSIHCVNSNTCYAAGGHGMIMKTTDGGATWTTEVTGTTKKINSIFCPDGYTCYAAGDSGTVLKLTIEETRSMSLMATGRTAISPNPMNEQTILTIKGTLPEHTSIRLFDVTGREVAKYEIMEQRTVINRGELPAGLYMYRISSADGWHETGKVVINP